MEIPIKPIDQLLERVLCMNILSSDYFKELYRFKTYHEVIDEIYNQVDHVEPWMTGNCRGPSTAFCLLYKFFTMKLTVKQMHGLLKHPDSPYIRADMMTAVVGFGYRRGGKRLSVAGGGFSWVASGGGEDRKCEEEDESLLNNLVGVRLSASQPPPYTLEDGIETHNPWKTVGFLYLRYAAEPKTLWGWFEPYVKDDEEFSPGSNGRMTTMGVYVRDLLLGQYYFDTLFPRIPVPVMRAITANLEKLKLPTKHCGVTGESTRGSDDMARRPPSVKAALSVSFGQRAPHRASTRDSSPVRRTLPPLPSYDRKDGEDSRRSPSRHRSQSRDLPDRDYPDRDRERRRERDRDRDYGKETTTENQVLQKSRVGEKQKRSRSRSVRPEHQPSPKREETKDRTSASSNLAKLRDMYGDLNTEKSGAADGRPPSRSNGAEETNVSGFWMFKVVKKPLRKLLYDQGNLHEKVKHLGHELDEAQKALDSDPFNATIREDEAAYLQAFTGALIIEERF
ncbi:pre-mRNA-splicing factor 38B-like protein isoform X1 [Tanacetum coccineum]